MPTQTESENEKHEYLQEDNIVDSCKSNNKTVYYHALYSTDKKTYHAEICII